MRSRTLRRKQETNATGSDRPPLPSSKHRDVHTEAGTWESHTFSVDSLTSQLRRNKTLRRLKQVESHFSQTLLNNFEEPSKVMSTVILVIHCHVKLGVPPATSLHSCPVTQLCPTPWTAACQASLSFTISQSLIKLMSIELVMSSNHLILCRPLLLLPSIFPSIRVFSNE